jgi:large subunit ribosomal protein L25
MDAGLAPLEGGEGMAVIPLTGTRREDLGKGGARKARAAGRIPGVLYGRGGESIALSVSAREFELATRKQGGNPIMGLGLDGQEHTALIRSVQYDPISHDIIHLDFLRISLTETIEVEVAIHLVGTPLGVKDGGGILEPILRELKVRCLPTAIPHAIEVDVTELNIGDSVHVNTITAPGVEILTDMDATVATVVPPTVQAEEKPAEEGAEAVAAATSDAPAEPEVIAKGKKEEGDAAEGKGGKGGKEKEK